MTLVGERVALVTGGADGIGRAVARRLASEGARVMIADVRADAARETAEAATGEGLDMSWVEADVTSEDSLEAAADACADALGVPTVVVANAGVGSFAPAVELSRADFARVLEINLTGTFLTLRAFARRLRAAGSPGSLIATASIAGLRGIPENAAYSASKFGVIGLVQTLAAELAPDGVRVNAVCPGQIETSMLTGVLEQRAAAQGVTAAQLRDDMVAHIPSGRLGTTDDVADAFLYLSSDLSRYVTGHALVVDGGWSVG